MKHPQIIGATDRATTVGTRIANASVSENSRFFFSSRRRHTRLSCDWSQTCALPIRSEEHTSELQSHDNLVCGIIRSEEHTSELQSHDNLVCRLLLEKKKTVIIKSVMVDFNWHFTWCIAR